MNDNILFSNDEVTIRKKPTNNFKPDFNYTDVPYSGRDVTNPFVDRDSYRKGQDFYPDRMYRDERTAQRQFFNSPDFQQSNLGGIFKNLKGMDLKNERDDFVKYLNEFQLRNTPRWNPKTKKYDGPMERPGGNYDFSSDDYFYLQGLDNARQNQFAKYSPYYGLSDEMIEDMHKEDLTTFMHDYGYGENEPADNFYDYLTDGLKQTARTTAGSGAMLFDTVGNLISNTFYPYDIESDTGGTLPRGFVDITNYTNEVSAFHNALLKQGVNLPDPDEWETLGFSEKNDINNEFKKLTGSKYDYDPTYQPLLGGKLQELASDLAEGPLQPSSSYEGEGPELFDPFFTQDYFTLSPMDVGQIAGELPLLKIPSGLKYAKAGIAKYAPNIIKKYPKIAATLGLTLPSITEPYFEGDFSE